MDPLEDLFNCAASHVQLQSTSEEGKKLDQGQLLELYGLYKSATIGPCNEPKPGIFNLKGRAKWDAWKQVSSLSKEEAQETYFEKVKKFYDWTPDQNDARKSSILGGNAVSTFAKVEDESQDEGKNEPIFGWAKDNELDKITSWLSEGNDVNLKDKDGLSILHWVVDRGHLEACKLLLHYGANLLVADDDGQTPLDYAITCEHENLITFLQQEISSRGLTIPSPN
ncbi:unnamed protein product [Allacma fusca]|uniref:Acyl-CoA-binding domain-containing protein 6 n=1 Tax=Allacma fusca TaxID=39272 RepID=A0A8J2NRP7_9HEXA|nr:unnamed protein product [Allacma fusca]